MNTKTFAQLSRNLLMDGVAQKLLYWGFDEKGNVVEQPKNVPGGYLMRGQPFDDPNVPKLWEALKSAISRKGIEVVVEEAAYTWFNRMMAMKILAKNGYAESQLDYAQGMEHTPLLLQRARQGQYAFLEAKEQTRLQKIITDYSKDKELFAMLLLGYCHSNQTLNTVFGKLDDYTELLLPDNMLQSSGFLHLLNTTDAISDEDYKKVELIGWLYQFYISQRKDEVFASFAKGRKAEAKDIPAATQIFTPNWIVKYMVENTAGRIWLNKHPQSPLKGQMKYYVENEADGKAEPIIKDVSELTLIDPAAGSGHILVEGFDLLYQMYMEEYYPPEEAVESILKNNLFGLDIDDRAAQLATFAILLKAASRYRDVFAKGWLPNVYAMPEAREFTLQEVKDFVGPNDTKHAVELNTALRLMYQAKNLGSVMKLKFSYKTRNFIETRFEELRKGNRDFNEEAVFQGIKPFIPVLLLLTKKYAAAVANPPYMGQKNMNGALKSYLNANYPLSKYDLFAVFMESGLNITVEHGLLGMINQHSWMFLSSYEKLRKHLLNRYGIVNMLHLGPRTFEELSGEVVQSTAFVLANGTTIRHANYYRLVEDKTVHEKEAQFFRRNNAFLNVPQSNLSRIPGLPIAYWGSDKVFEIFDKQKSISTVGRPLKGLFTGDNGRFLKYYWEVNSDNVRFNCSSHTESLDAPEKWYPYQKGGGFRKWYGKNELVINFQYDGKELGEFSGYGERNPDFYFQPGLSWSSLSTASIGFRKCETGFLFDSKGPLFHFKEANQFNYTFGFLNSNVCNYLLATMSPTLDFNIKAVAKIPFKPTNTNVDEPVNSNCRIAKKDWDSRETSWDFEKSPLLNEASSIEDAYQTWQEKVTQDFSQLHANEQELNRIFIDIYGLQEELTPEVPLRDITILQEELDRNALEALEPTFRKKGKEAIELPIKRDEVISQFISYAIGLFMGRYRLDKTGLNIAHPNPSKEELASYAYNGGEVNIDEDAILPVMGKNANFKDDALYQFNQLLDTIWGQDTRTENINFIENCLNKDLEKFFVKDFYKYHCDMYKKKPIYWLFSSPKGSFQVLVYMHSMNEFTAEKIRANYLLEHIKKLRSEEKLLKGNESGLSTQEAKRLDQVRKDILECEAYDLELKNVADEQIKIDLDEGVTANYELFKNVVAQIK
jgi:hypothetical protein